MRPGPCDPDWILNISDSGNLFGRPLGGLPLKVLCFVCIRVWRRNCSNIQLLMSRPVRNLIYSYWMMLCIAPAASGDVIRYASTDFLAKGHCCSMAADRPSMRVDDFLAVTDAAAAALTDEMPDVRLHGPSWLFFFMAIMAFIAAKTLLFYRPVHRATVAYARLYWALFNPLEF